jgi:hypothetical protein
VTHTETPHSAASAGSGYSFEINIAFTPNPKVVTCDEISFVQTSRVVQPGTNTNKEYMEPQNSRRNANNEAVDRIKTRKQGWYGYNNDGTHASTITPGKSSTTPVIAAKFYDKPSDAMTNVSFNFETAVIAKSGSQANLVYSVIKWGFDVDAAGAVTAHTVTVEDRVSAGFGTAVDAWNKQAAGPAADRNAPDQVALPTFR